MSGGILGIFYFDGRPVEQSLLERMAHTIQHRAVDGIGYHVDGSIGMATLHFWSTPESVNETQPLSDGNLCISLHGRVDNRDELIAALAARDFHPRGGTDAELILGAYRVWGEECPEKILGDFAFVVWDADERQLFCARDTSGWKPFYYYRDHQMFVWASEFPPFFCVDGIHLEPNLRSVGEYLCNSTAYPNETLYKNIVCLPAAHYMMVTPKPVRLIRHWGIDCVKDIRYRSDDEYAEHFLDLFKRIVQVQMRANGKVGADLSGGLDSSSVVSIVQMLFRDGTLIDKGFEVFSMAFPGIEEADEVFYFQEVIKQWGLTANIVDPRDFDTHSGQEDVRLFRHLPASPNGTIANPLKQIAKDKGFRVILTGIGGDDWFTGSRYHYADFIRNFHFFRLCNHLRVDAQFEGWPYVLNYSLLRRGIAPLLPPGVYKPLKRLLRKSQAVPAWITPQFAEQIHLRERQQSRGLDFRQFSSFALADQYDGGIGNATLHAFEMEERATSKFGLEQRQPMRHRLMAEFAMGIPNDQLRRFAEIKHVLRHAMTGILPEVVRQRRSKAEGSSHLFRALEATGGALFFKELNIERLGWVNGGLIRNMYEQMADLYNKQDFAYRSYVWPLWITLSLELWYREVFLHFDEKST